MNFVNRNFVKKLIPAIILLFSIGGFFVFKFLLLQKELSHWTIYSDKEYGFEIKYPQSLGAGIWKAALWPPKISVQPLSADPVKGGCPDLQLRPPNSGAEKLKINGSEFTLYKGSDIGAGFIFNNYCFVTQDKHNYYVINFVMRYHAACQNGECGNYCGTEFEKECRDFNMKEDIEEPIKKVVSTFRFIK